MLTFGIGPSTWEVLFGNPSLHGPKPQTSHDSLLVIASRAAAALGRSGALENHAGKIITQMAERMECIRVATETAACVDIAIRAAANHKSPAYHAAINTAGLCALWRETQLMFAQDRAQLELGGYEEQIEDYSERLTDAIARGEALIAYHSVAFVA